MTLREVRNGRSVASYADFDKLPIGRWGRILGVSSAAVESAAVRAGASIEVKPAPYQYQHPRRLVPVSNFPNIVAELAGSTVKGFPDAHYHAWAVGVDTKRDFEVRPPSGVVLVYKYEPKRPVPPVEPPVDNTEQ